MSLDLIMPRGIGQILIALLLIPNEEKWFEESWQSDSTSSYRTSLSYFSNSTSYAHWIRPSFTSFYFWNTIFQTANRKCHTQNVYTITRLSIVDVESTSVPLYQWHEKKFGHVFPTSRERKRKRKLPNYCLMHFYTSAFENECFFRLTMGFWEGEQQAEFVRMHDGFRNPPFPSYPNMNADTSMMVFVIYTGKQMYFRCCCCYFCCCCNRLDIEMRVKYIRANKSENEMQQGEIETERINEHSIVNNRGFCFIYIKMFRLFFNSYNFFTFESRKELHGNSIFCSSLHSSIRFLYEMQHVSL